MLKRPETNAVLLFDGLDESPFLNRERGGLQHFFNFFNTIRVPAILTVRTEFWVQHRDDLREPYGTVGPHNKGGIKKHVQVVELVDWEIPQMLALTREYAKSLVGAPRERIDRLTKMIADGQYAAYYGEIPRRPLFLRMILDTASISDMHQLRRAELFREWAVLKIERDAQESQRWGTTGRPPIADETTIQDTITLSFAAMETGASLMTTIADSRLILLPSCEFSGIAQRIPTLAQHADTTGLGLNSLLVPLPTRAPDPVRLRFAHLLFHEFFLARYIAAHPDDYRSIELPPETANFLQELTTTDAP
jgi:hypothetical protein